VIFDAEHYVPVLKLKRAEKSGLQLLNPSTVDRITPLFEVVEMKQGVSLQAHLSNAFRDFEVAVGGLKSYFIDAREIAEAGAVGAQAVFSHAAAVSVPFVPVTGIQRVVDVQAALGAGRSGIAIRLVRSEFEEGDIQSRLSAFLTAHGIASQETDLIVDLGPVEDMVTEGIGLMVHLFLRQVPSPRDWRTLSVVGSAFPKSMGIVGRDSSIKVPRSEWLAWERMFIRRADLPRMPSFGDCGIQHPSGVEGFDFRTMQASSVIRYALPESWLLLKGRGTRVVRPSLQFPALARLLHSSREFMGAPHCNGCRLIAEAAGGALKLGSPEAWRRIGTIHHITTVAEAIGRLPAP